MEEVNHTVNHKKLILHFDVDVIKLPVSHSKHLFVHELCSECIWGTLQNNNKDNVDQVTGWKSTNKHLSRQRLNQQSISYKSYLQNHLKLSNQQYQSNLLNLVETVDAQIQIQIQKFLKNATLPKTLLQAVKEDHSQQNFLLTQYIKTGKYVILPAFFKLLLTLKKNQKQFAIVIKNHKIKDDHTQIISQLNMFFIGKHPLFNGKNGTPLIKWDGSNDSKNFVCEQTHQNVFYMLGEKQLYSTYGTLGITEQKDAQMFKQKFKNFKNVKLCEGEQQIYQISHKLLTGSGFIYEINPYHSLVLDPNDQSTHQIYFTSTQQPHVYSSDGGEVEDSRHFVVKVDLLDELGDIDYLIKKVASVQGARRKQMDQVRQKAQPQAQIPQVQNKSYSKQQKQSNLDYIKKHLLPVLQGAFRQVDLLRPQDPIAFIALYCLKNQQKFK